MLRFISIAVVGVVFGCQAAPQRIPLGPLPDDTPPMPYAVLVVRMRQLAMSAHEAFYLDRWEEVTSTARALEQSAQFLAKSRDVPPARAADLMPKSELLVEDAIKLGRAAKAIPPDIDGINAALQRIHFAVRALRPGT